MHLEPVSRSVPDQTGTIVRYDETSDSMIAATSGTIIGFSTNPHRWVERACGVVGRDWDRLVPATTVPRD